jgi:PDZ domain-containing protein
MRRRGVTVLTGAVLLILLIWQTVWVRVPFVELAPGPTVDTLGQAEGHPVIAIQGTGTSTSAGQLRLVTVSVISDLTLLDALRGWLRSDVAVVPHDLIYPPGKSEQEVDKENEQDFRDSQTSAETAALRKLGYPVQVAVKEVVEGAPAQGTLQPGDVLTAVDGTPVTSPSKLTQLIRSKPAGTDRTFTIVRNGATSTVHITPVKSDDGRPRIGVTVESKQPHPFEIKIDLDKIGGPSAGLMFTLGIIDKLDPTDLTGGLTIAGTGTIDDEGAVGPIGGIAQKLVAAKAAKASAFLTPAANCAEAVANAQPGLPLVKVSNLDDAMSALQALRDHRQPPLCAR